MFNTAYQQMQSIGKSLAPYYGGICKWWYVPIEFLDGFPAIDPVTQQLESEPLLKAGKSWYGPVNIVNKELGFVQAQSKTPAGPLWKRKVTGFMQGNDSASHINMSNLPYHQLCIVAKLRAGGFFIILGNEEAGLSIANEFDTGNGQMELPGSKLTFADECKHAALVLPSFAGTNSEAPPTAPGGSGGGSTGSGTDHELVEFNELGDTEITWNGGLQARFGDYPTIEIWAYDSDNSIYYRANFSIEYDTTISPKKFVIKNGGGTGFIKIT